ncbi:TIM-barrel domain-containing protein [Saccharicrinis sp. FJH62]|uniref:TIM-barrel domain-containing protein n=1 Tax=Saccharicrinis sp. FJH62 TaxID=3344657 RepID=UPI0035D423D9
MKHTSFLKLLLSGMILITSSISAQYRTGLINDDIAVFYPENFNPEENLPSFALVEEPEMQGELPSDWDMNVAFSEAFGKSMAEVEIAPNTDLYATGEQTGNLVRNGTTRRMWNTDNFMYERDNGVRLYQSHPWVLGVNEDGSAFGVLADNTWQMELSLGKEILFSSAGPAYRVFVIKGKSPQQVMVKLASLIGTIEMPPLWSLGYQQCRWSYYPASRVKEIADTFRLKQIPCDVIWMDIHYMDAYKIFTFSPERFPNPENTNAYLHNKGYKSVWMIDPGVAKEDGYSVYDSGTEKDVWVKTKDNKNYVGNVWPGPCVFPDFTQEKTQAWWSALYKDYMATGIDGVWNDMNEPAVFDGPDLTMPVDNIHKGGKKLPEDVHLRYHNVYGMMMVKASREGIEAANPDKRPFILTRSNFIGGQRYAATWTGDNAARWDHLKMSIPMSINLGLSGQPFNGPDIGGFAGNATPELWGQWIAIGAFYPFSRAHTTEDSKNQEPWVFGKEIEDVARTAIERRYRLLPYFYTLFHQSSENGMPVMRPVFFADPADKNIRNEQQAFMLGSDLLIVPKWAYRPKLPGGIWKTISLVGENSETDSYQPDVKLRGGTILPLGQVVQSTAYFSNDSITLYVCPDDNMTATGRLYSDAGDGYGYRKGEFACDVFEASATVPGTMTVTVTRQKGDMKFKKRVFRVGVITGNGMVYSDWSKKKSIDVKIN